MRHDQLQRHSAYQLKALCVSVKVKESATPANEPAAEVADEVNLKATSKAKKSKVHRSRGFAEAQDELNRINAQRARKLLDDARREQGHSAENRGESCT